jgi:hypothetical protein
MEGSVSTPCIQRLIISFADDGTTEVSVTYSHQDEPATPGSKKRTQSASQMASAALQRALEGLGTSAVSWGGFGTNTRVSTDKIVIDRKRRAA